MNKRFLLVVIFFGLEEIRQPVSLTKIREIESIRINYHNYYMNDSNGTGHQEAFQVYHWRFEEMKNFLISGSFIIVLILMKIAYHQIPLVSKYVPESCLLVVIGILFGVFIKLLLTDQSRLYFKLTPELFFYILLPPIILESSYSLYHRNFLDNFLSILVFALIGTLLSFLIIGFVLFGFVQIGLMKNLQLSLLNCLLFSSLIVAVDPVAVLTIFHEIGINEDLYYLVFGESLLNNAVVVVLYEMLQEFELMKKIETKNIIFAFISFFTVSVGGMVIGTAFGICSCIIIRLMGNQDIVFLEPLLLISMGYMSYLCADMFRWSGIISIITCCLMQAAYALRGVNNRTSLILKRFVKGLSSICEAFIYLFLGVEIVIGNHSWEISFIVCLLLLCIFTRFIVIFSLSGIINHIHISIRNISVQEKFIISYGGLKGAITFSLAVLIKPKIFENCAITSEGLITSTLIIILFSIIVQGVTIKPLTNILQISKIDNEKRIGLFTELSESVIDATTKGVDGIIGKCGRNYFLMMIETFSNKYLQPLLQGNDNNHVKLVGINDRINEIILSSLSRTDQSQTELKRLPSSYKNLLKAMQNVQPKPIRKRSIFRNSFFNKTPCESPSSKRVKSLMPYLYRASAIVIDENDNWTNLKPASEFLLDDIPPRMKSFSLGTNHQLFIP